jgi:hypothetical protein
MTKIKIEKNDSSFSDIYDDVIIFSDDKNEIIFYQAGSGDLYFSSWSDDSEINMEIDKFDNYKVYMCFDNLYNKIKKGIEYDPYNYYRNKLFDGKIISYQSDAYSEFMCDEEKYCYLNIYKLEDKYLLKFINEAKNLFYSLSINTNRSRYGGYKILFMELYRDLSNIDNQITIDEYLYKQKVRERKK